MPTISPARTSSGCPAGGAEGVCLGRLRPAPASATAPGLAGRCCSCGGSAADHQPRQAGVALLRGVDLAGDLAAAQHGAVVAQRADLVELVADVEDAAALRPSWRSVTKSLSTACGVSTEVGSSRISNCGLVSRRARSPRAGVRPRSACAPGAAGPRPGRRCPDTSRMRCGDLGRLMALSSPSQTFSAAVRVSNSEKCWNTMLMPSARVLRGWPPAPAWPFQWIWPSSGCTAP
jgi:hypothetical protein